MVEVAIANSCCLQIPWKTYILAMLVMKAAIAAYRLQVKAWKQLALLAILVLEYLSSPLTNYW